MYNSGDIVIAYVQFADSNELKIRPALVLYSEFNNYVVAGITSNIDMQGVKILKSEGIPLDSVIKLNYIYTISPEFIKKKVGILSIEKRKEVYCGIVARLNALKL